MRVERYMFSISGKATADNKFYIFGKPDITIRPRRMFTAVQSPNQVYVESIKIGNVELLASDMLDAYLYSMKYHDQVVQEFMKEIGAKTKQEMYSYCEDNDVEIPDSNRIDFPTIEKGQSLEVKGHIAEFPISELFILSIQGECLT
jgi:hypothetical protein